MQYADALSIIRETALGHAPVIETVTVAKSCGRVCAEDVFSEITLPPFTNSGVDGFAVPFMTSVDATRVAPLRFKIAGTLFPGEEPKVSTPSGHAWEIMTGAPVPLDCDACAKVEDTIVETEDGLIENARSVPATTLSVSLTAPLQKNENLRFAGTDFDIGTLIARRGDRVRAEHVMALASVGRTEIKAYAKPKVLLVSTGKELVGPGQPLKTGEIYNSTRSFLMSSLEALGCDVEIGPTMADEKSVFVDFMKQLMKSPPDLLITTGAVSMGSADFIRPALEELNAKILFHRVDVRPGRPILFASLESPKKKFVVFGLPGNPVSGVVGARFFVETYLRTRAQQKNEKAFQAKLASAVSKPKDLRCFFKAQLVIDDGEAKVHLMKGQPSYMVRPLLQSSIWAVLGEGKEQFQSGDLVDVYTQESLPYDLTAPTGDKGDFA